MGGPSTLRALHSRSDAARSLRRLHELADETRAMVVFGHDAENWAQLQHHPGPYPQGAGHATITTPSA